MPRHHAAAAAPRTQDGGAAWFWREILREVHKLGAQLGDVCARCAAIETRLDAMERDVQRRAIQMRWLVGLAATGGCMMAAALAPLLLRITR